MDIFKFRNPTISTKMEQGEIINGLKTKMWVEKYRSPGEFKFVANSDVNIREKLPIGSFVSHVDSHEIMIVENHELTETKGRPTEVVITGRGFETFFDHRIVGSNKTFPTIDAGTEFYLGPDEVWNQAVWLILNHISPTYLIDDTNALLYTAILTDIVDVGTAVERTIKRGSLYDRLIELLDIEALGIKIIRPGSWSPLGPTDENTVVMIHQGSDLTQEVILSYDSGELESADYLWSNQKLKNAALITGKWVETWVSTVDADYNRRIMYIDASDIDNSFTVAPTGTDLDDVVFAMQQRGIDILLSQNDIALTKAEVSKEGSRFSYRTDFAVGDIVTVFGDYNETSYMRISEYVEIEDENGRSGYPTLTMI
ncbi:MAG: hypothetical protein ABWY25_11225 [Paenisporosarcina sp.]